MVAHNCFGNMRIVGIFFFHWIVRDRLRSTEITEIERYKPGAVGKLGDNSFTLKSGTEAATFMLVITSGPNTYQVAIHSPITSEYCTKEMFAWSGTTLQTCGTC